MEMNKWLNARCSQLLTEINSTPLTDDSDNKKLQLIMAAMRESSVEMFQRAAERSRKDIQNIHSLELQTSIDEVNAALNAPVSEEKQTPKQNIKLTSSVIRRSDSF